MRLTGGNLEEDKPINLIKTVSAAELSRRLPVELGKIDNGELGRRLRVRSDKARWMAPWLYKLEAVIAKLKMPYWQGVKKSELEEVHKVLLVLADKEVSEQVLNYDLVGKFALQIGMDHRRMLRWISSPEMIFALVESEEVAKRLVRKWNWELMRLRR